MRIRHFAVALLTCSFALSLQAQKDPCLDRVVPVTVRAPGGEPVRDLSKNDFAAELEDETVEINSTVYDAGSRRVVLLLDASPIMGSDYGLWRAALAVAQELSKSAPAQVSLALLDERKSAQARVPFGQSRELLAEELTRLSAEEKPKRVAQGMSLEDALREAVGWLSPMNVNDAICVISDGPECTNCARRFSLKPLGLPANVRLFAFVPVYDTSPPPYPQKVLRATGGLRDLVRV